MNRQSKRRAARAKRRAAHGASPTMVRIESPERAQLKEAGHAASRAQLLEELARWQAIASAATQAERNMTYFMAALLLRCGDPVISSEHMTKVSIPREFLTSQVNDRTWTLERQETEDALVLMVRGGARVETTAQAQESSAHV